MRYGPHMTIPTRGLAHVGIRVHDWERALRFYGLLGFTKTAGPFGPEKVVILDHPSGLELNLIANAAIDREPNVLMDIPVKHAGITHVAILCDDLTDARAKLEAAGFPISGEQQFPTGAQAIFVRDPDGTVVELHQQKR